MLSHLPNGYLVVVPGRAHVAAWGPCPSGVIAAFLHEPTRTPDTACIMRMRGADFSRAPGPAAGH